jgi:phage FluMu protein Com
MPIEFRCSQCNQLLRVSDQSAGKAARCPKCQTTLKVPGEPGAATQPTAPAAGGNDPFAPSGGGSPFSDAPAAAAGGFGGGAPPKPDPFAPSHLSSGSSNPFGEAKPFGGGGGAGTTTGLNPYASPSAAATFTPSGFGMPFGARPGLPWENSQSPGSWWETAKLCMLNPTHAFSIMRQEGGIGNPILFSLIGQMIGAVFAALWQVLFGIVALAAAGGSGDAVGMVVAQSLFQIVGGLVGAAAGATIGTLIAAGIMHLFLMIVGAANKGYEATFRTMAFANGALSWTQIVPVLGPIVGAIWMLVIQVIGLSRAQETDIGKVIIAIVLEIVACMVLVAIPVLIIIFAFGAAIAGANAG